MACMGNKQFSLLTLKLRVGYVFSEDLQFVECYPKQTTTITVITSMHPLFKFKDLVAKQHQRSILTTQYS